MAVYKPAYRDKETGEVKQTAIWWYRFNFAGRRIRESSKSTRKTIAVEAEKKRHKELEARYNDIEDRRDERIRTVAEVADGFLADYQVRNPHSATFAKYALGHLKRLIGRFLVVDITGEVVMTYQTDRLKEKASPKSVNEEVGFLLRILGEQGDFLRAKLRRSRSLKLTTGPRISRAFTPTEKTALLEAARKRRSPSIYPALMLALHAGMRDAEIRELQWARLDLHKAVVTIGEAKTEAGEGRTIPLNEEVLAALVAHSKWYLDKFGETRPQWFVFPAGRPQPTDPTRPPTSFKTAWTAVRNDAGAAGRWHDNRHTWITDLAESGEASDETIRDLAGHVSKQMLKHYSHIRMQAKRWAVDSLVRTKTTGVTGTENVAGATGAVQDKTSTISVEPGKEMAKVEPVN